MLEIIRSEIKKQLAGGRRKRIPRVHVLATIDNNYTSGRPMVLMDDDTSNTPIGPFPVITSYTPAAGDRVLMAKVGVRGKYIILGDYQ